MGDDILWVGLLGLEAGSRLTGGGSDLWACPDGRFVVGRSTLQRTFLKTF